MAMPNVKAKRGYPAGFSRPFSYSGTVGKKTEYAMTAQVIPPA
jgi:hypothetical protein